MTDFTNEQRKERLAAAISLGGSRGLSPDDCAEVITSNDEELVRLANAYGISIEDATFAGSTAAKMLVAATNACEGKSVAIAERQLRMFRVSLLVGIYLLDKYVPESREPK